MQCKRAGLHTCLETEGCAIWEIIAEMILYVNIWLYDIEHMDPQKRKEYTDLGNELMLKNLAEFASRGCVHCGQSSDYA